MILWLKQTFTIMFCYYSQASQDVVKGLLIMLFYHIRLTYNQISDTLSLNLLKKGVACGSFLNTLVNKLPFEMHLPGHNFTDPGTKLYKTLNPDGSPKEWSLPINRVDNAAYHHDLCY